MRRAAWFLVAQSLLSGPAAAQEPTITSVAGGGYWSQPLDGVPATSTYLDPVAVAVDSAGNLFVTDIYNQRVRKVDPTGTITTVAGSGPRGTAGSFCGDGGPATSACLYYPRGITIDAAGNLFIADTFNERIRRVDRTGTITTVAGNGTPGFCGDGGAATSACLRGPVGVAMDAGGNLYIAEVSGRRIRRVDRAGTITTVAGSGDGGTSLDGVPATSATLHNPWDVAADAQGNLFIVEDYRHRVRRVDAATGIITTVAGNGTPGFCGDDGPATSACLDTPYGVAVDANGNLFVSEWNNHRVRRVEAATGIITTVAGSGTLGFCGDGGPATAACLNDPHGVAVDAAGTLFIADRTDRWRRSESDRVRKVTFPVRDLASLRLRDTLISGCLRTTARVTLTEPAPLGGLAVTLHSDNPAAVVPASVTMNTGATRKNFTIETRAVASRETATIEASLYGGVASAVLTIVPMGPKSVTLTPNPVVGGAPVMGLVTLPCPAGPSDIEVTLTSTKAFIAEPTSDTITIPVGTQSFSFEVRTTPVFAPVAVTVKATAHEVTRSKKLTMNPVP